MGFRQVLFDLFSAPRVIPEGLAAGLSLYGEGADRSFFSGIYEKPIQDAIAQDLSPGDVFFDVGANIGFFSLIAARRVGSEGRVYAFEPVPRNADAIRRNAKANKFETIDVFVEAIGAVSGRAELLLAHHIGGATLSTAGIPPDMRGRMEVDVISLDTAIAERKLRPPSLVKIDVEGGELDVLRGMIETLRTHHPKILYEIDDATKDGLERKLSEIAIFLDALGYSRTHLPRAYDNQVWNVEHVLASFVGKGQAI